MYKDHPNIETPPKETVIWKYMDLWKFLDIVDNEQLYCSRADTFEDKFEGRIPNKNIRNLEENHPLKQIDDFSDFSLKKQTFLSCWSCEQDETYPLWKIYSNYRSAIAIQTTVGDLIKSISIDPNEQFIGKVNYVNPTGPYTFSGNTFQFFFEKRSYFQFEKEVRLLTEIQSKNHDELLKLPFGTTINIDPKVLINSIYLAPLADVNFKNLIELKLKDINIKTSINFSDI